MAQPALEEQYILRVPPELAEKLKEKIRTANLGGVELAMSGRTGSFTIDNESLPTSLVDLPCIVETHKTIDNEVMFKSADIGQMFVVHEPDNEPETYDNLELKSGLTPPTKYIRRRRFRKHPKKSREEVGALESELVRVMTGGSNEDVDIEVVHEDEDEDAASVAPPKRKGEDAQSKKQTHSRKESDDDDDDDEEFDDDDDFENELVANLDKAPEEDGGEASIAVQREEVQSELREVDKKIKEAASQMGSQPNPVLKERYKAALDVLNQRKMELLEKQVELGG